MWNDFEICSTEDVTLTDVYCTNGVFRVKCREQVQAYPEVQASFRNGRMVVAIDKNVILMDNDGEGSCELLSYDNNIDCIGTVNGGQVVICGLVDGHVHGLLINGIPVFDLSLPAEDIPRGGTSTFVGIYDHYGQYYLMTCAGALYTLEDLSDDLNLQQHSTSVGEAANDTLSGNRTLVYDKTLISPVHLRRVFKPLFGKLQVLAYTILGCADDLQRNIVYCDAHFIYQHALNPAEITPEQVVKVRLPKSFDVIKKMVNLENYVLLLTVAGGLYQFCGFTKTVVRMRRSQLPLHDLLVLENDLDGAVELMVLERKGEEQVLKIVDFPAFKCNYELALSEHCWLVAQPKASMNMYYMEGLLDDDDEGQRQTLPNVVELKQITELDPMQRFKKLVYRGLIDEAEAFARETGLSLEMIHEHRVQAFVTRIANERNTEALERTFKDFMELLGAVNSIQLLANQRLMDIPDRALKERFLKFLLERLLKRDATVKLENEWIVLGEIEEQLNRLDTLKIIDAYSLDWHNFVHELNLVKCCLQMLKTHVQDASLIWSRHSNAIVPFISSRDLPRILASLPKDTELIDVLHWLRHITPSLIQVHSPFMALAVKWCVDKTKTLEATTMWPANGLQFMRNVHSIFSAREFMVTDSEMMYKSNMDAINQMLCVLQELAELKSEFNLTIKLDSYCDQDLDKTALNLLQRVQINHLRKLLTDFVMPLFLKSNKSADSAMAQYIQFLVENRKFTSQWQEKAVVVIEMLTNEDDRLQLALLVLNIAPVPWIEELRPLIAYGKSSHPLATEIVAKHQLQVVKMIRIRYDYPPNASDNNNMQLVYRIVKLDRETMVGELQSIVKLMPQLAGKVYVYCISHWIQHERLEVALPFYDDFSAAGDVTRLFLLFEAAFKTATEMYMQNVIHFLNIIASRSTGKEVRRSIDNLNTVYKLRSCYGIALGSISNLRNKPQWILDEGIASIQAEMGMRLGHEDMLEQAFLSLTGLCQLVRVDCVVGVLRMAQRVNQTAFTFAMASLLLDWEAAPVTKSNYESHIELGVLVLAQVIEHLTTTRHQDLPMYPLAYEILARCMSYAKLDVLELNQLLPLIRIGRSMYQCLDCARFFERNKRSLTEVIVQALSVTGVGGGRKQSGSRRESTRRSRRDSYSVFNDTMSEITVDQPAAATATNYTSTNVDLVINCLSVMMEILVLKGEEGSAMSGRFRKFFDEDFKEMDLDVLGRGFTQVVNQMYQNKMLWEMHLIFQEMLKAQQRLGFGIINAQYSLAVTRKLLGQMLAQEEVDVQDCYLILIKASPREMLVALEQDMKLIVERRNFYSLSEHFHICINRLEVAAKYKALRVKYTYFAEISKLNPSVKLNLESFNASALPYLKISLDTLKKLCHEFSCDYQDVVLEQTLQILRTKELKFEVLQDGMGVERIKVLTSVESILEQCVPLVNEISADRVPLFAKRLMKFAETIDSYFYEMYLAIIEILSLRDTLPHQMAPWKGILRFLQHKMVTRRRVRPSQAEMEWWSRTQSEASVLPKIAKYRFPFLRLQQSRMETLGEEINVENCVSWIPLISACVESVEEIDHEIEVFCSRAVKNSINEWKMQSEDNRNEDVWHLVPENNDFLQSILRLLQHIKSEFKAFSILYYTMNHMPEGADQVEAAYECYNFMLEHEAALVETEKAKDAVAKIRRKYPLLKTQHLLHVYKMTDDSLMELIEKPLDLLASLYLHPVLLNDVRPNVMQLVTEIAEVHNLPLHSIQVMLLRKLLRLDEDQGMDGCGGGGGGVDVDASVMILDAVDLLEVNEQIIKSLELLSNYEITHRVNYILSGWSDSARISFLITQMHSLQSSASADSQAKYILLYECLATIPGASDESKQLIGMFKQDEFITCKIVYMLHRINFLYDKAPVTACSLLAGNRIDMLKELWKSYAKTPEMIEAMLLICLRFNITVKEIWDSILKKMVALHMKQRLLSVIDWMGTRPELAMLSSVPLAIQYILMDPLKSATREKSPEVEMRLSETLLFLQTCRMTSKLDLCTVGEKFVSLERPYMAAVILSFMSRADQRKALIKLLEPYKNEQLKRDIDELCEYGVMSRVTQLAIRYLYRNTEEDELDEEEDEVN